MDESFHPWVALASNVTCGPQKNPQCFGQSSSLPSLNGLKTEIFEIANIIQSFKDTVTV